MLRLLELALFAAPFLAFAAWWALAAAGLPTPGALALVLAGTAALVLGGAWYAGVHSLPPGQRYVPATLSGGTITPGHGAAP